MKAESAELRNAAQNYGHSALHDDAAWARLHNATIDYVLMRLTDGAAPFSGDCEAWLKFVRANPSAFASVFASMFDDLKYRKRVP